MSKPSKSRKKIKPSSKLPKNKEVNQENEDITQNYIQTAQMKLHHANQILCGQLFPNKFKFREKELCQIQQKLKQLIMGKKGQYKLLMITGSPGSGKTLCTNKVLQSMQKEDYKVISLNSNLLKKKRDMQQILADQLLTGDNEKLEQKQLSSFKLINSLQKQEVKQKCILYVEEAQLFFNSHRDFFTEDFFDIFKNKNLKIVFLGISNTIDALEKYGPKLKIPVMNVPNIVFEPYTIDQMKQIIFQKISQVYNQTGINIKIDQKLGMFIANKINEYKKGDMRIVFEFLKYLSHSITDEKGQLLNEIEVNADLVNKCLCKSKKIGYLIETLPLHSQVALLGIYRHIKDTDQITIDDQSLKSNINYIYGQLGLESMKDTTKDLQYLITYAMVEQKVKRKGTYMLKISLNDIENYFEGHKLLNRFI